MDTTTTAALIAPTHRLLADHPLRAALTNEVHARPPEALIAPLRATHLAMVTGEGTAEAEARHLARLCAHAGIAPPPSGTGHYSADFGTFRLKWERHTEFSSYTVFRPGHYGEAFADPALNALPADWLAALPGQLLTGIHVAFLANDGPFPDTRFLAGIFGSESYVGGRTAAGAAVAWTDFRIHGDGFSRLVIRDQSLGVQQAGRLVQRLLEIESYRMMALLALPLARAVLPRIAAIETELADLTRLTTTLADIADERALLDRLSRLAAANERIAADTNYRFSASRAYYDLVAKRLEELREERIEGLQTIGEFMSRRLGPAIRTCEAVSTRHEALSARIARASNLLRTRVDIALEAQNQSLLRSMDRRAHLQLRLQETVEGLSAVAISYYLVALIGDAMKAFTIVGLPLDPDLAIGIAVPFVLALVWGGVRRLRRVAAGRAPAPADHPTATESGSKSGINPSPPATD